MRAHPKLTRLLASLTAAATAITLMAGGATAEVKDPAKVDGSVGSHHVIHRPVVPMAGDDDRVGVANATGDAIKVMNDARAKVGARPVVWDGNLEAAVKAHANYLELNKGDANLNPGTEVSGKPGYTSAGAQIAPWTMVARDVKTYAAAMDLWLMDPWERSARVLHPLTNGIVFAQTATFVVAGVNFNNQASQAWPQVYPGNMQRLGTFNSTASSYYASKCSQKPATWGYPITVQWDPQTLAGMSNVRVSLQRDGVSIPFCVISDTAFLDMSAQVVIMPTQPLVSGSYYSGTVTGTAAKKSGGSQAVSATIGFTTSTTNKVWGDQTGDGIGDLLGVDDAGNLRLYKGRTPGVFGSNWQVGPGWGTYSWFSHTPDVNGDGRDDLIGRRTDGSLWLYFGQGMGSYTAGRRVGTGWNTLKNITVVGSMTGNKSIQVVGIVASGADAGALMRYTLSGSGFSGKTAIGKNWNGVKYMTSLGSFNSDATADIIAVANDGLLYAYYTRDGKIIQKSKVGQGWANFTALFAPGDLTGDKVTDLVGRRNDGVLVSFANNRGSFSPARQAGHGWNGFRLFG